MLEVLIWSCKSINRFWRCVYGHGLWLTRLQAESLVRDGWAFTVSRLLLVRVHKAFLLVYLKFLICSNIKILDMQKYHSRMATALWHSFRVSRASMLTTSDLSCICSAISCSLLVPSVPGSFVLGWQIFVFEEGKKLTNTLVRKTTCNLQRRRLDIQHMLEKPTCAWILNITIHATWADEDFIGRMSRVSRRCHVATTAWNTIYRALGFYRRHWGSEFSNSYLNQT